MSDIHELERQTYFLTGRSRGATKAEIKFACRDHWDEKAWKRMVQFSSKAISPVIWYDREYRVWRSDGVYDRMF